MRISTVTPIALNVAILIRELDAVHTFAATNNDLVNEHPRGPVKGFASRPTIQTARVVTAGRILRFLFYQQTDKVISERKRHALTRTWTVREHRTVNTPTVISDP